MVYLINVKKLLYDVCFCFTNYFIAYIPIWQIRKVLYKLMGLKIGEKSRINMRTTIYSQWKVQIGTSTLIKEKVLLDGRGGLTLGNNCSVSVGAVVFSSSHYTSSSEFKGFSKKTIIEIGVWLCANSIVLPGSIVKNNCIIGANSVYKGISKPNMIYQGNPAVLIRARSAEEIHMEIKFFFR